MKPRRRPNSSKSRRRSAALDEKVRLIVEANPLAFPSPVAGPLLAADWQRAADRFATKTVTEHGGEITARRLLEWFDASAAWQVPELSFDLDDERETAEALDAPTILAWRLLEDLHDAATAVEDAAIYQAAAAGNASLHDLWTQLGDEAALTEDLQLFAEQVLFKNPWFFPPFLLARLDQGVIVSPNRPEIDPEALGFFETTEAGSRIVLIAPNLLTYAADQGAAWLARETLVTLCHESEHLFGEIRGYDPLGDREDWFDRD